MNDEMKMNGDEHTGAVAAAFASGFMATTKERLLSSLAVIQGRFRVSLPDPVSGLAAAAAAVEVAGAPSAGEEEAGGVAAP